MASRSGQSRRVTVVLVALAASWALGPATAWAQTPRPAAGKWTIEVHGGALVGGSPVGGKVRGLGPGGTPFTTDSGRPSRVIPSWYFGDGTTLFNQVSARFLADLNMNFGQITGLDSVLGSAGARRQGGAAFGVRVTRRVAPRLAVEVGIDRRSAPLVLTSAAKAGIEESRVSFSTAMGALLRNAPVTGLTVTSSAQLPEETGTQTSISGAVLWTLARKGRLAIHAIGGAGRLLNSTDEAEVRLRGNYQFSFLGQHPMNETDVVTIRFRDTGGAFVGLLGAGLTYDVSARAAIRVDARIQLSANGLLTSVDAAPLASALTPAAAMATTTTPAVQFSTAAGLPSSLSGRIPNATTFTGSGMDRRVHVAVGYVFRF